MKTPDPRDSLTALLPSAGLSEPLPATCILLAEDCDDNILLIRAYLKGPTFDLDVAKNGQLAVAKILFGRFHLVLMDVHMPVMDGHAATRAIRQWEAQQGFPPMPILAL